MKRILPLILVLFVAGLCGLGVRYRLKKRVQRRREAVYEAALRSYTQVLKPGMTRKEVEDYLRAKNIEFRQICCVDIKESSKRRSWDDLTRIGEEDVPFVCRENNVYVAFQFTDHEQRGTGWQANDLDALKALSIYHSLEGCL
jgi:hypothetical protein